MLSDFPHVFFVFVVNQDSGSVIAAVWMNTSY